jgi:hypothetical protein
MPPAASGTTISASPIALRVVCTKPGQPVAWMSARSLPCFHTPSTPRDQARTEPASTLNNSMRWLALLNSIAAPSLCQREQRLAASSQRWLPSLLRL